MLRRRSAAASSSRPAPRRRSAGTASSGSPSAPPSSPRLRPSSRCSTQRWAAREPVVIELASIRRSSASRSRSTIRPMRWRLISTCRWTASTTWSGPTTTTPASGDADLVVGREGGSARGGGRPADGRRRAARRPRRPGSTGARAGARPPPRRCLIESGAVEAGMLEPIPRERRGLARRARAGPARRGPPPRRPGPGHRPGRLGQDAGADRADPAPARRPRLPSARR